MCANHTAGGGLPGGVYRFGTGWRPISARIREINPIWTRGHTQMVFVPRSQPDVIQAHTVSGMVSLSPFPISLSQIGSIFLILALMALARYRQPSMVVLWGFEGAYQHFHSFWLKTLSETARNFAAHLGFSRIRLNSPSGSRWHCLTSSTCSMPFFRIKLSNSCSVSNSCRMLRRINFPFRIKSNG